MHWQNLLALLMYRQNSIDAVSDRDFAAEYFILLQFDDRNPFEQTCGTNRFVHERRVWILRTSDAYSTGSSLMPQKKNPDMFELARGKAGH